MLLCIQNRETIYLANRNTTPYPQRHTTAFRSHSQRGKRDFPEKKCVHSKHFRHFLLIAIIAELKKTVTPQQTMSFPITLQLSANIELVQCTHINLHCVSYSHYSVFIWIQTAVISISSLSKIPKTSKKKFTT